MNAHKSFSRYMAEVQNAHDRARKHFPSEQRETPVPSAERTMPAEAAGAMCQAPSASAIRQSSDGNNFSDQVVDVLAASRPELLAYFSRAELREQAEQFTAALVAIGRLRKAQRDPLE